jgi:aspartate/methionine/tyrosine aminotransferase
MVAKIAAQIPPFIAMEVFERAMVLERAGAHVIHLEVGEPDFPTPLPVQEAAMKAIRDGKTKYTHSLGILELREAIARRYHEKYQAAVSPEQVLVSSGTSPLILLVFLALLEAGEEVIMSDPRYACYPNYVKIASGLPVSVPVTEEDGFQLHSDLVQAKLTDKTKAIFINSPANPTGQLLSREWMEKIARLSPWIVSDEIYHGLVYEGQEHSILEFTDRAFVFNGFSKLYAMTGWRVGYCIAPKEYIRTLQKMHQNFFICANSFAQWAALTALTDKRVEEDVARMKATFNERRQFMIKRLREMGFGIAVPPNGAFYILANAKKFSADSYKFAFEILEGAKVGVTPGIDFGPGAEGYIRFSYANSIENIKEAMERIERFLKAK